MIAALRKQNGPAEAATSPDHGSITQGNAGMNNQDNITSAPADKPQPAAGMNRRTALKAGVVLALTSHTPAVAAEPAPELPVEKVNRLAAELAHALNDYSDGQFHAVIYPSADTDWPIQFRITRLENDPMHGLRQQIEATKAAMGKAYPGKDIHSYLSLHEDDENGTIVLMTDRESV